MVLRWKDDRPPPKWGRTQTGPSQKRPEPQDTGLAPLSAAKILINAVETWTTPTPTLDEAGQAKTKTVNSSGAKMRKEESVVRLFLLDSGLFFLGGMSFRIDTIDFHRGKGERNYTRLQHSLFIPPPPSRANKHTESMTTPPPNPPLPQVTEHGNLPKTSAPLIQPSSPPSTRKINPLLPPAQKEAVQTEARQIPPGKHHPTSPMSHYHSYRVDHF